MLIPTLKCRDAHAEIAFLREGLGFEVRQVHEQDGRVAHAELHRGGAEVMLGSAGQDDRFPLPPGGAGLYLVTADPDALFAQATAAGAEVVHGLVDQDYGSREFCVRDPEGNLWSAGTYDPRAS